MPFEKGKSVWKKQSMLKEYSLTVLGPYSSSVTVGGQQSHNIATKISLEEKGCGSVEKMATWNSSDWEW